MDGTAVGMELPATVIREAVECAPAMKAAGARAGEHLPWADAIAGLAPGP